VFARSIETVKDLYADGILPEAGDYPSPPYPFILMFKERHHFHDGALVVRPAYPVGCALSHLIG